MMCITCKVGLWEDNKGAPTIFDQLDFKKNINKLIYHVLKILYNIYNIKIINFEREKKVKVKEGIKENCFKMVSNVPLQT